MNGGLLTAEQQESGMAKADSEGVQAPRENGRQHRVAARSRSVE